MSLLDPAVKLRTAFLIVVVPALGAAAACRPMGDDEVAKVDPSQGLDGGTPAADAADVSVPGIDSGPDSSPPPDPPDTGTPMPDVTVDDPVPPPVDAQPPTGCEGTSPVISVRRTNGDTKENCASFLAAHTFTHALCSCEDMSIAGVLATSGFDSNAVDGGTGGVAASVGVGGAYTRGFYTDVRGSLTIAGSRAFSTIGFEVAGDFRLAGGGTATNLTVKRDLWLGGRVGIGVGRIERNMYMGPGASSLGGLTVAGTTTTLPSLTIEEPCGCGPDELLDVGAMVTSGAQRQENARIRVDPNALNDVASTAMVPLPCGRFYFDRIGGAGAITLLVTGRAAVFVEGNVQASDLFRLQLEPGAEIDLFIRGNLTVAGSATLGDITRPGATRIYVGGTADIQLPGGRSMGLNLYAPYANVNINAGELYGSVFAKSVSAAGALFNRYDRSVVSPTARCTAPPPDGCDKCQTCNAGTACIGTTCTSCTRDEDCCVPFVCELSLGLCQMLPPPPR